MANSKSQKQTHESYWGLELFCAQCQCWLLTVYPLRDACGYAPFLFVVYFNKDPQGTLPRSYGILQESLFPQQHRGYASSNSTLLTGRIFIVGTPDMPWDAQRPKAGSPANAHTRGRASRLPSSPLRSITGENRTLSWFISQIIRIKATLALFPGVNTEAVQEKVS